MADVEHHWHDPTQGQVVKALHQYFTAQGIGREEIAKIVEAKVGEVVGNKINAMLTSKAFDNLIVAAVIDYTKNEKALFERTGGYGLVNHIRDLIQKELQETVLKEYKVSVTKVGS